MVIQGRDEPINSRNPSNSLTTTAKTFVKKRKCEGVEFKNVNEYDLDFEKLP